MKRARVKQLIRAVAGALFLASTPLPAQTPSNDSRYRRVENWAQLPPGYR
jgi:hypothetical protein